MNPSKSRDSVLVVEDDATDLELLTAILTEQDYTIHSTRSGELALQFVHSNLPDLILLDVKMPGMDGYAVCAQLKADAQTRDIPVIFLTGMSEPEDKVKGFEVGAVDFVTKPYRAAEVRARVKTHLTLHATQKQLAARNAQLLKEIAERQAEILARTQAEAALHESEARLHTLIDNLPLEFWAMDRNLRYTMQNTLSHRNFQPTVGKRIEDLDIPAALKTLWIEEDLQVLEGKTLRKEYQAEIAGEPRDYENIVAPVIVNGAAVGLVGVAIDVTARKHAEEALRESEARYRTLFENSPMSLWEEDFSAVREYFDTLRASGITDYQSYFETHPEAVLHCAALVKIRDVNQATLTLLGAHSKEELSDGLPKFLADETLTVFRQELIALAEGATCFDSEEETHRTLSGELRYLTIHTRVAPGYENSLSKVLVSLVDTTARKQAEMALLESEERLRTLINAMPDLVVFKDGDGCYLESNNFNLRFFRLEHVNYRGKKDSELAQSSFFYRSALATWEKTDEAAWRTQTTQRSDEVIPRPDGPPRIFDLIKVPMFHPDGRRKGLVVVGRDITERKQAEEGLRKAFADLERRVEQRTEEIVRANARLKEEIVERKRAQDALKQSEQMFRSIVERSEDGITLTDEQGIIIEWNASQERITGLTRAQVIGQPIWDVQYQVSTEEEKANPETYERIQAAAMELHDTGKATWLNRLQEREIMRPDGTHRTIQLMPFAIATDKGVMRASIVRDITEQRRSEQALRESEERHRAIVEAFDGLIYICSQDNRVEFMNRHMIERTGYNGVGALCYQALHNRDSVCPWCVNAQVFQGKTVRWEILSPKDNHWYYVVDTPLHHANGSMSKLAMIMDITERKEAEQAQRSSEERYRQLFEDSPVSQWEADFSHGKHYLDNLLAAGITDFRTFFDNHPEAVEQCLRLVSLVDVNRAALALFRAMSKEDLAELSRIYTDESRQAFREGLITLAEGQRQFTTETVHQTLTGERITVLLYFAVAPGYETTLGRVLVSVLDITARRRAEQALREIESHGTG